MAKLFSKKNQNLSSNNKEFKNEKIKEKLFFIVIRDIVYKIFIGCFLGAFILFFTFAILYNTSTYVNLAFYSGLGLITFLLSYLISIFWVRKLVKNQDPNNNQIVKKSLIISTIVTVLIYFLLAWLLMILIGTFNGFGIAFANTTNSVNAFSEESENFYSIKVTGFILFYITIAAAIFIFLGYWFYLRFKNKANVIFNARRKQIQKVRDEAQKRI
ncbi:hypothetical protein MCAV_01250 [[Mycoplasma] cavipharyngis]|uniref:hypothetical protein n=1 Tax=[Mycoplasma] cavipharyngis TaxID=92757 RepID=UPI0037037682